MGTVIRGSVDEGVCVNDVGAKYGLPAHYDVCEGVRVATRQATRTRTTVRTMARVVPGKGDCDPGQCGAGLVCTNDVGAQYGLPAHYDVCEVSSGQPVRRPEPGLLSGLWARV